MQLGFVAMYDFVIVKNDIIVVKNVGGIDDELTCDVNVNPTTNTLNVGSIHFAM